MMKHLSLGILISGALMGTTHAQTYLCVADQASGFKYNEARKGWETRVFKAADKFLVKPAATGYDISQFGLNFPVYNCSYGFNDAGGMACSGLFGEFRMNNKTLRFVASYMAGYFYPGADQDGDTPSLQIGTCTKM